METRKANDPCDPVTCKVEKGDHEEEMSPYSAPEPYFPPGQLQAIAYEDLHPYLQGLQDEHGELKVEIEAFEATLDAIVKEGPSEVHDHGLRRFFHYIETTLIPHNRKEEKALFPLLRQRLIAVGEHSPSTTKVTAVEVLNDDHLEFLQLAAVMTNFFRIAPTLADSGAQQQVLGAAIHQGRKLIESLKLHIFREDEVVFILAASLVTAAEFDAMAQ